MRILEQQKSSAYLLIPDSDTYHSVCPCNSDGWNVLFDQFKGKPVGDAWTPIPVKFKKGQRRGDFPFLLTSIPVFSERALQVLKPLVANKVEVLPLECQEELLYAINVLDVVDCLDHSRSKFGFISGYRTIKQYAFKKGSIGGHHLFKLDETPQNDVLVSNRFKSLVEQNGLLGLTFEPVG